MTDLALLETVGRFLFGPQWKQPMADAMGVSSRTIRRWLRGETKGERIRERARAVLDAHRMRLEAIEDLVDGEAQDAAA